METIVDIIPSIEGGDVKKVFDNGMIKYNQIILSVFNQLNMELATLDDFPDDGCLEELLKIYFSEEFSMSEISDNISDNLSTYQMNDINVSIIKIDDGSVNVEVTIKDIPNFKMTADLVMSNQRVKIVNPNVIT